MAGLMKLALKQQRMPVDEETGEVQDTEISTRDAGACKFRSPRHDLFSRGAKYHPRHSNPENKAKRRQWTSILN